MKYESPTSYGIKVMANVQVFFHATDTNADTNAESMAMTLLPQTYFSRVAKDMPLYFMFLFVIQNSAAV